MQYVICIEGLGTGTLLEPVIDGSMMYLFLTASMPDGDAAMSIPPTTLPAPAHCLIYDNRWQFSYYIPSKALKILILHGTFRIAGRSEFYSVSWIL